MTVNESLATKSVLTHRDNYWVGAFSAMASPCEILVDDVPHQKAIELLEIAQSEAHRIEQKFSRYRDDNVIHEINTSDGKEIVVDVETAKILDYAEECWKISDGLFDVTSGILRRVWKFDGSDRLPTLASVNELLSFIGWEKVKWKRPTIKLLPGMEIDLGGIGKEYAVDTTSVLLRKNTSSNFVVNYGGDLFISGPRRNGENWSIGIDDPKATGIGSIGTLSLSFGGVATSGDSRRFLLKEGIRYPHILNPKTGWPVVGAPHSVTVLASTSIEAGILSTLAMLHGAEAEKFLQEQEVKYLISR